MFVHHRSSMLGLTSHWKVIQHLDSLYNASPIMWHPIITWPLLLYNLKSKSWHHEKRHWRRDKRQHIAHRTGNESVLIYMLMVPLQPYYFALYCHDIDQTYLRCIGKLCLGQYVVSTGRLPKKSVMRQAHNVIQVAFTQVISSRARTSYANITLPSTNKTLSSYLNWRMHVNTSTTEAN